MTPRCTRNPLADLTGRFVRDEQGSITVEFVIVIPLLMFLVLGGLTYWDAFHSNSRTAKIAYAVNDIMTRHDAVNGTDMAELAAVVDKMLPSNMSNRMLRVTSICVEDGTHKVLWSYTQGAIPAMEQDAIPMDILPAMQAQSSVIVTELTATWRPKFWNVGLGEMTFNSELVGRPRVKKIIPHSDMNASNICPSALPPTA